jgi:3-keto-disaccharide hydrolase
MTSRLHGARVGLLSACLAAGSIAMALAQTASSDSTLNHLTAAERKAGWTLLFDGKSLDNWRGYKKADASGTRWVVQDGLLCLPPAEGSDTHGARDIVSKEQFDQFELTWDWRISQGGNSGLKYFVVEDQDAAIGHEYQLIDDERHPDAKIGPKRQTAALYDVLPAANRPVKPAGEWNHSRVVVKDTTVEHWLNGTKVLTYQLSSESLKQAIAQSKFKNVARFGTPQRAHILLQDHGNAVCYRNVKIKSATAATPKPSAP